MDKKRNLIVEVIVALIMITSVVFDIYYSFVDGAGVASNILRGVLALISYLLIIYYIIYGYKLPHGNLLKYIMLFYAVTVGINAVVIFFKASYTRYTFYGFMQLFIAFEVIYMAGRLNKIRQNTIISLIILIELIAGSIMCWTIADANTFARLFNIIFGVQYVVIALAYYSRYKAHKEAGLEEASRNK